LDGTQERVLAQHKGLSFFNDSGPAWSPDGKIIACGAWSDPINNSVVEVSVEDGTEKLMTSYKGWTGPVDRVTWLRDGSGLIVVAAADVITGSQIWHLAYPSGEVKRITNDLNSYGIDSLTLTADLTTLAVVQQDRTANFWLMTVNEDTSRAHQITHGKFGSGGSLAWTPDGKIVFPRRTGDMQDLWIMDQDGTNQRQLTADAPWEAYPMFSPDGRYLVFNSDRDKISHIWRMDADATNPKQLTDGNAEDYSPVFTPDGRWVLFASWRSSRLKGAHRCN
jgi:Tol biopolymer transport system component